MKRRVVPATLAYTSLGILGIAAGIALLAVSVPSDKTTGNVTKTMLLPTSAAVSSCRDSWPGYQLPAQVVLPGPNLSCAAIDAYGLALNASCDASCGSACQLRSTGHTWNCTESGSSSSRAEMVWLCPRSPWDLCDPRPPSPCEIDDTYCDSPASACPQTELVQQFWPSQILNYFGIPAGDAQNWNIGDAVSIADETFTITCIAIGSPTGGQTTCGNDPATFDIIVVRERPTQTYPEGTCVEE